jgi:hypothetical protein
MKSNVPSIILLNHFILIRGAAGWDEGNFTIERLGPISRRSIRSSNSKKKDESIINPIEHGRSCSVM